MGNLCDLCDRHAELRKAKSRVFGLRGHECYARVDSVYDGDTFHLTFKYLDTYFTARCRAVEYDSPEMKPPDDQKNRDAEIKAAILAKEAIIKIFAETDNIVYAYFDDLDKYGRPLVKLYRDPKATKSINTMMIELGHGYPYKGGTKKKFTGK